MPNNAPSTGIRPNNAEIYEAVYDYAYALLPPETKAQVLAVKANNDIKDTRVEAFISNVVLRAEMVILDYENEDIKKLKKEVDTKTSPK